MANVTFKEPAYATARRPKERISAFARLIIALGLAKNNQEAQKVIAVIGVIAVFATIWVIASGFQKPVQTATPIQNSAGGI
ncbi:MAG: hypothetical protein KA104_00105 [Candidatus Pacebacteria bacterium]|nr:hypothetical protein [Candidatus Paceibacterota bacterium]